MAHSVRRRLASCRQAITGLIEPARGGCPQAPALGTCATVELVTGLRWVFIFLFWAALDLSGSLLLAPAEVFEESEEAAHRSWTRRRDQQRSEARSPSARASEAQQGRAQLSRMVTAARGPRPGRADTPRKLPPSGPAPDSASDDH
jgi:hypothetical protein